MVEAEILMKTTARTVRDDRVLPYTRGLSLGIVPFLVGGFVILYLFPQHTARLWAWPLRPAMTSMVLASPYLGGAYFFWSGLYFAAPLLVIAAWLTNGSCAAAPRDHLIPQPVRAAATAIGIWRDPRWSTLRRMLEVEIVMLGLILLAALRARDEFDSTKPLAWPLLIGFSLVFVASVVVSSSPGDTPKLTLSNVMPTSSAFAVRNGYATWAIAHHSSGSTSYGFAFDRPGHAIVSEKPDARWRVTSRSPCDTRHPEDPEPDRQPEFAKMMVHRHDGDREQLRPLFREADDSEQQIDVYLGLGTVFVAEDDGEIIGHLLLITGDDAELKSMAVAESRRGTGVGRALVRAALEHCRQAAVKRLLVATAAADIGNLRFYQRQGFRMLRIERDAFGPSTGYPDDILIDGIPLRDRVWLSQEL